MSSRVHPSPTTSVRPSSSGTRSPSRSSTSKKSVGKESITQCGFPEPTKTQASVPPVKVPARREAWAGTVNLQTAKALFETQNIVLRSIRNVGVFYKVLIHELKVKSLTSPMARESLAEVEQFYKSASVLFETSLRLVFGHDLEPEQQILSKDSVALSEKYETVVDLAEKLVPKLKHESVCDQTTMRDFFQICLPFLEHSVGTISRMQKTLDYSSPQAK